MIGFDTNLLVRLLVDDDAKQSAAAERFVLEHCSDDSPGYVNRIVLCELVWVLQRAYRFPRAAIADILDRLLRATELHLEDSAAVRAALEDFQVGPAGFADCLIATTSRAAGIESTATFDREAAAIPGFVLVE